MKAQQARHLQQETLDSFDYCLAFWQGAEEAEEGAREAIRELLPHRPRHVRAFDDLA